MGPFGTNQYCGTVRQLVGKAVKGRKPTFKKGSPLHRAPVRLHDPDGDVLGELSVEFHRAEAATMTGFRRVLAVPDERSSTSSRT